MFCAIESPEGRETEFYQGLKYTFYIMAFLTNQKIALKGMFLVKKSPGDVNQNISESEILFFVHDNNSRLSAEFLKFG